MSLHREMVNEIIDKAMNDEAEVVLKGYQADISANNPYPPKTQEYGWWEYGRILKQKPCGFVEGVNSCSKLAS